MKKIKRTLSAILVLALVFGISRTVTATEIQTRVDPQNGGLASLPGLLAEIKKLQGQKDIPDSGAMQTDLSMQESQIQEYLPEEAVEYENGFIAPESYDSVEYKEETIGDKSEADISLDIPGEDSMDSSFGEETPQFVDIDSNKEVLMASGERPSTGVLFGANTGAKWYYNTGKSLPSNADPKYNKYRLLSRVQPGDILYEAQGGFGVTGHVAIVEGIYYSPLKRSYYIRIVEAIDVGVVYSCLDDTRIDDRGGRILRVNQASRRQKAEAINFCLRELGAVYFMDFRKDTSPGQESWYCSELVWAAYMAQGIDIETRGSLNEPGITPRDILRSDAVVTVSI